MFRRHFLRQKRLGVKWILSQTTRKRAIITTRITNRAFTLVELLVVTTIIVLLLTLLLPAMKQAAKQMELVVCASNLREVGFAELHYTANNDNNFSLRRLDLPNADFASSVDNLKACLLYPYAPDPNLYVCQTFISVADSPATVTRSYVANWNKGGGATDNSSENVSRFSRLKNAANFVMYTEEDPYLTAYSTFTINDSQLCAEDWPSRDTLATYHLPYANRYQVGAPWGYMPPNEGDMLLRTGIANVTCADGHVETCNTLQTEHRLHNDQSLVHYPSNPR